MNKINVLLVLVAVLSAFAAATGGKRVSSSRLSGTVVKYHSSQARALLVAASLTCVTAAVVSLKKRILGWRLVLALLSAMLALSLGSLISDSLFNTGSINELAWRFLIGLSQAIFWGYLLVTWFRQKEEFGK
ncbi:hypothetical protein [Oleiharenicola lentus]|uniref:hypothetical protein n=1 Tax=Oleiharenicola lentus TaxID=2508720 RepID=UPI003F67D87D